MLQRQRIQAVRHEARRRGELLSDSGNTSNRSTPRTPALVADTAPPYKPLEDDVVSASNVVLVEEDAGNSQATALHALDQNSKFNKSTVAAQVKDAMQAASAFTSEPPKLSAPHVSFAPQPRTSAERGSSNGITEAQQPVKAEPNAAAQARMYENDDNNAALATPPQQRSPDARRLFADDTTHEDQTMQNGTTTTTTTLLAVANASPSDSPFPAREGSTSDTPNPRLHNAFLTLRQHQQAGMHRVPLQGEGGNDAAMNSAGLATLPAELSNGYAHYTTSSSTAAATTGQAMQTQIPSAITNMNGVSRPAGGNVLVPPISLAAAAMSNSASSPMQNGTPSSARRDSIARIENSLVQLQLELAKEKKHNLEAEQRIFALQREMEALRNENASLTQSLERYKRAYPIFTGTNNNNSETDNGNDAGQTTNNGSPLHNASTMPGGTQAMLSRMQTLEQHVTSLTELLQSKQAELDTKTERIRRLEHKLADTLLAAESPTRARMTTNADASVAAGSTRYQMSAIIQNNNESVEGTSMTLLHPTFVDPTPRMTSGSNTLTGQTATMTASDMSGKMISSPRKAEVTRTVTSARRGSNADNRNSTTTIAVLPSSARARNARRSSEAVVEPPSTRTSLAASSTTLVMSASAIPATTTSAGVTKKDTGKEKKKASAMRPPTLNESALEMQPSRIAVQPASAMVGSARGHRGSLAQATVPHAVPHSTRCSASAVRRRPASPMKRSATNREYSLASTQHAAHEKSTATDKPHKAVHTVKHTNSTVKEVKQRQPLYAEEQGKEGGPAVRLSDEPESMPSEVASVSDIQSFPANSTTHAREYLIGSSRNRRRSTPQRTASATRTSAEAGTTGTHPFTHHNATTLEDSARRLSSARGLHNTSNNGESEAVRPLSARRVGSGGMSNSARRASSPAILQKRKSSTAGTHESGPFAPSSSVTVAMLEERPMLNNSTPLASLAQPPPRSMLACRRPSPARSVGVTTSVRLNTAMRARPQISYNAKEDATTIKGTTTTVVLRGATPSVGRSGSAALQRPPSRTSPARSASSHVRAETNASPLVAETYEATVNMNNEGTTMKAMQNRGSVSGQGETRLPRMDSSQSPGEETTLAMTRAGSSMEP